MRTIGIMGGTFNPIHKGHVSIAVNAHKQFNIPKIWFMPTGTPAYKDFSKVISDEHRCNMVKLAIADYDYMELSTIEIERGGNTYTADTLAQIKDDFDLIYFIIGADSLFYLDKWYKPEYICANCVILCANRDCHNMDELNARKDFLAKEFGADIRFIQCENLPYSSTKIRNNVSNHIDVEYAVGKKVSDYIKEKHLYE